MIVAILFELSAMLPVAVAILPWIVVKLLWMAVMISGRSSPISSEIMVITSVFETFHVEMSCTGIHLVPSQIWCTISVPWFHQLTWITYHEISIVGVLTLFLIINSDKLRVPKGFRFVTSNV